MGGNASKGEKKKTEETTTESGEEGAWKNEDIIEIVFPIGGALAGTLILSQLDVGILSLALGVGATSASLEHLYADLKPDDTPIVKVGGDWVDRLIQNKMDMNPVAQSDMTALVIFVFGVASLMMRGGYRHFSGCMLLALGEALTGSAKTIFEESE